MPYQVMLVDDEEWALVYLKKIFDWEKRGFHVAAEAPNADMAMELAKTMHLDVIVTDIRMPGMSGIDLMRECRSEGVRSEFVIVSGFAEFIFAQEAVRLGAFEYILKPIGVEEADQLLLRLTDRLQDNELEKPSDETELEALLNNANGNFESLLKYMKDHLHEKLQLKDLAQQFYLNPNYCCHLFNKFVGKTFSEYLTELRMNEAARMIKNKQLTIDEVGQLAGYPDYFYFNKVFKKYYGVTPNEFRRAGPAR